MQSTEQIQRIESISTILLIAGILLIVIAILIAVKAFGGWSNLNKRIAFFKVKKQMPYHEEQEERDVQEAHDKEALVSRVKAKSEELTAKKQNPLSEPTEDSLSETVPLQDDGLSDTRPLSEDLLDSTMPLKKAKTNDTYSEEEDTAVLTTPVNTIKFKITKKLIITHDKEGES